MAAAAARSNAALAPERLQLVLELGRRVTSMLDLQTLLPEACKTIAEAFGYDMVGINLLDPLDDQRLYQAAAHPPSKQLPRAFRVPLGIGLTGWVARHGTPRLSNDVTHEPLYVPGPGRHTRSELDVPLQVGQRTIGVLNVESERPNAFVEDDIPYLQGLASQLAQAIENARLAARARDLAAAEERALVARDLHDETAQSLVAVARQLDLLLLDLDDRPKAIERIESLHRLVDTSLEGVRRLSRNLRPAILEDLGLVAALGSFADELASRGLHVDISIEGNAERLAPGLEYAVFRIAQEALNNVARHASVDTANLDLAYSPEQLVLTVIDHGTGFDVQPNHHSTGQGLLNMRDRAASIGAELSVVSHPGDGTTVQMVVPLELTLLEQPQ